jgi:hypothetical protein
VTWSASKRLSNVPAEESPRVPADSVTVDAPPRTEASANGAGSAERTPKKRMLIIVAHFS